MIAPVPDRPACSDGQARDGANAVGAAAGALPFAALLARLPAASGGTELLGAESVRQQAERFNEDGFFGRSADADAHDGPVSVVAIEGTTAVPVPGLPAAGEDGADPVAAGFRPTSCDTPMPEIGAPPSRVGSPAVPPVASTATPAAERPGPVAPRPVPAAVDARSPERLEAAAEPIASRGAVPRRATVAGSSVAVALRALEQGVEVVARLETLGESERVRLADEIAALLAAHGFAPVRVAVTARSRAPR